METRLRVDWILCDGYGLCGDLLPDLIPSWGIAGGRNGGTRGCDRGIVQ